MLNLIYPMIYEWNQEGLHMRNPIINESHLWICNLHLGPLTLISSAQCMPCHCIYMHSWVSLIHMRVDGNMINQNLKINVKRDETASTTQN